MNRAMYSEFFSNTSNPRPDLGKPIGWFATKHNMSWGWSLYELEEFDKKWMPAAGFDIKNCYRIGGERHGNTSIVRINIKTGTVAFMDSGIHPDPKKGEYWFDRAFRYNRLLVYKNVDSTLYAASLFPYISNTKKS